MGTKTKRHQLADLLLSMTFEEMVDIGDSFNDTFTDPVPTTTFEWARTLNSWAKSASEYEAMAAAEAAKRASPSSQDTQ